ncbi:flagellar protein FlgN [Eubacteriales bacterium OttesenSCG-928-N14]|nr:flagellar protein FlgN [Eubacteriales bacterium OttesenSCG-928-N14]
MDALIGNLAKERAVYEQLLQLSIDKKDVIIAGDVNALEAIVKLETESLARIKPLEQARKTLVLEIAKENNIDSNELTLEALASLAPECAAALLAERELFSHTIGQIQDSNDINRKLIDTQIEITQVMLNAMGQLAYATATYTPSGATTSEHTGRVSMVDHSV